MAFNTTGKQAKRVPTGNSGSADHRDHIYVIADVNVYNNMAWIRKYMGRPQLMAIPLADKHWDIEVKYDGQ